jgi:hypothetical protein
VHDLQDPRNQIDYEAGLSNDTLGKECLTCGRCLVFGFYRRDASFRDGFRDQCLQCEAAPRLSMSEQSHRVREMNFASEGVRRQRWDHQDELRCGGRVGRPMRSSDFLAIVQKLVPCLYITQGRIVGDLAIYQTAPCPQAAWDGRDFRYLFFCPTGVLPEFSTYEFDDVRDIAIKEKDRGWRTVLLRLIRTGLLSEDTCNRVFGRPEGPAAARWHRSLYQYRNQSAA